MGNNNTKSLERRDEQLLQHMSQGMDTLRKSIDAFPDGTKKFKLMLESNEKQVHEVLRRSRKGRTRTRALDVLHDLETLKGKETTGTSSAAPGMTTAPGSVRESVLDNGAVESTSIIAGDARKYDRHRQHDKAVDELQTVRRRIEQLRASIASAPPQTAAEADAKRHTVEALVVEVDRVQVQPNSKFEEYKNEYRHVLKKYERKLAEWTPPVMVEAPAPAEADTDGAVLSKQVQLRTRQSQDQSQRATRSEEQRRQHQMADELAIIQGTVMSLRDECDRFDGLKDSPEYEQISQRLMQLWDKLGYIDSAQLREQRDANISLISSTLKELNRRCAENSRNSLSKNKLVAMVEMFHMQYQKIALWLAHEHGARDTHHIYQTLDEIRFGLQDLLAQQNQCQLVTARLTPGPRRKPLHFFVSSEQLREVNADKVYIRDDDGVGAATGDHHVQMRSQSLQNNQSCPNLSKLANNNHRAHTIMNGNVSSAAEVAGTETRVDELDTLLDQWNYESITLKYNVEAFEANDKMRYDELDERLIQLLIDIEGFKGECNEEQEALRASIIKRVHAASGKLVTKCKSSPAGDTATVTATETPSKPTDSQQQLEIIEEVLQNLEVLQEQIDNCYDWDIDNPEYKVLEGALKSAMVRLDLIEAHDNRRVRVAKLNATTDVQTAIERLHAQRVKAFMAGTEV